MNEHFGFFYKDEHQFVRMNGCHVKEWKRAVQDTLNDVIFKAMSYPLQERSQDVLIELLKSRWLTLSPQWFRNRTEYYLWLVHISSGLLPFLEKEAGQWSGWFQYRKHVRDEKAFTVPMIRRCNTRVLYVFEKERTTLLNMAEAIAFQRISNHQSSHSLIHIHSIEDGKSVTFRYRTIDQRKQGG